MSTATAYNPQRELNRILLEAGASKTVYALVTPETEAAKDALFGDTHSPQRGAYKDMFRGAWTSKQDSYHREFFQTWLDWSSPVIDFNPDEFRFAYPTAGASEALRHMIYDWARGCSPSQPIHVFKGEYEGYKAMAEACRIGCIEHDRDDWKGLLTRRLARPLHESFDQYSRFYISMPSAIDGDVWQDFNAFLDMMPPNTVIVDATYVGGVPQSAIRERFNLRAPSVHAVVFSLSKPFGAYYDRIGGVFMREEDEGLFGNMWFKNLTSLALGTLLMKQNDVFKLPTKYAETQRLAVAAARSGIGFDFAPADVYMLATATDEGSDLPMAKYLRRAGNLRVCVTAAMANLIGTADEEPR
jgi:hypothetical protein